MALLHFPLHQLEEKHLRDLIAAGAAESGSIDYKRTTYGNAHSDYSELLADVSSFANSGGGDLVLGMDAKNGIPTALSPLTIPIDPEVLRLEQAVRGGLQPRIANFSPHVVPIQSGGNVLLLRIPRSYNAPHRIIRQNSNRFWARSAAGKYEPDVNELRRLFDAGPQLAQKVQNFRLDRIAKIAAGRAPVRLMSSDCLVLHVIPLSAFDQTLPPPLHQIKADFRSFVPMGSSTANASRITFDGVLKTSNADQRATEQRAYVQVHRSGIVESVASRVIVQRDGTSIIFNLDDLIIKEVERIMKDLAAYGLNPPFALLLSLVDVETAQLNFARPNSQWGDQLGLPLDRPQYHFDEVIFDTIPTSQSGYADAIRPILDQIANAGGESASPVFDDQGHYIALNR